MRHDSNRLLLTLPILGLVLTPSCVRAQDQPHSALCARQGPYEMQVLVSGSQAPLFHRRGESYVLGEAGSRYTIRVINRTSRRVEAVVSVDGRDVLDGGEASYREKRGYLVPAYGSVDIDGWRLSSSEVAAFRFSTVADSYAARSGSAREVGVVGVAIFPERPRPVVRRAPPVIIDDDHSYRRGYEGGGPAERSRQSSPPAASPGPTAGLGGVGRGFGGDLAAGEARAESAAPDESRPGLGTEFGERRYSAVRTMPFVRASASSPAVLLGARYNDREGLLALGIDVDRRHDVYGEDAYLRRTATPFPTEPRRSYATPPDGWEGR